MRPKPSFVAYVDEAGDPSVKHRRGGANEASEWFVVSAVVVSADRDHDAVDWVRDMREAVRTQQHKPLHYRSLSQTNRERVCRMLSNKPVRLFVVASHKSNMRGRRNARMATPIGRDDFYNWCLRLLFERVTAWCDRRAAKDDLPSKTVKVVFSERGGHDYHHLRAYFDLLDQQSRSGFGYKLKRKIVADILDPNEIEVRRADDLAGLQLADISASAFFQAVNTKDDDDLKPASALKGRVARDASAREAAEFGLLRLPFPHHGDIPEASRPVFSEHGYHFKVAGPGLRDTVSE